MHNPIFTREQEKQHEINLMRKAMQRAGYDVNKVDFERLYEDMEMSGIDVNEFVRAIPSIAPINRNNIERLLEPYMR